jgi:organic hydroperoxide reductase OsmC/OhrA
MLEPEGPAQTPQREAAQALLDKAHQICPYSKVTRGNIDVAIKLV